MRIYVAGIHTDVGKTHVSLAICANFSYSYFKPIQAGSPTDSEFVKSFCPDIHVFKEGILLQTPASPHVGKINEGLDYNGFDITLPKSDNLVIELAGGIFSPIDEHICMVDYMQKNPLPTIIVGRYYIGAINHVLLSVESLMQRNIKILCIVMNGKEDKQIDSFISKYTGINVLHLDYFNKNNFVDKTYNFKQQIKHVIM